MAETWAGPGDPEAGREDYKAERKLAHPGRPHWAVSSKL